MDAENWKEQARREAEAHYLSRERFISVLEEIRDATADNTQLDVEGAQRGPMFYWKSLAEAKTARAREAIESFRPLPKNGRLRLEDFAFIRRHAERVAKRQGFPEDAEDFGSYMVQRAWETQNPVNYRLGWFNFLSENFGRLAKHREHAAEFSLEEASPIAAQPVQPSRGQWDEVVGDLGLEAFDRVTFLMFFQLGYTVKEIAYIQGVPPHRIKQRIGDYTKILNRYFGTNIKRTKRFA